MTYVDCVVQVIQAINDLTMRLVTLILWYSPIGIFFLIAGQFAGVSPLLSHFSITSRKTMCLSDRGVTKSCILSFSDGVLYQKFESSFRIYTNFIVLFLHIM